MQLKSSAFSHGEPIPKRYTCEGEDISPDLSWSEVPKETQFFALMLHDPDAPRVNGFTHWVLYNIPRNVTSLEADLPRQPVIPGIGMQGKNDAGRIGYMGPCPPSGTHRYFARLYALREPLPLEPGASYQQVLSAMEGKIIGQAELLGTYSKRSQKAA
jgi:Raf kinase inhibitor-like YbhB/YbcL family protein